MLEDDEDNEALTVERRLGKLEGWTRGHQAVCDLRFMVFCAVVGLAGAVLTIVVNFGLDNLKTAQAELHTAQAQQTVMLQTLLSKH